MALPSRCKSLLAAPLIPTLPHHATAVAAPALAGAGMVLPAFANRLLPWFEVHGRHDLPWQVSHDPYKVWVSEIMLQQTQVKTVLNYFERFMQRFATVQQLAQASWDEVAPYWAGLGYYARARNLHQAARQVVAQGAFPDSLEGWMALPGIGRSTAGAVMSLGLGQFGVIMDANVKRVLARHQAVAGDSASAAVTARLWQLAQHLTPSHRHADYNQAMMDLGATLCTSKKPLCLYCPVNQDCQAFLQQRVLDFPQKKAKPAVAQKQAIVLIIEQPDTGHWLWQQRPASGVWGGLYCLPIMENQAQVTALGAQFALIAQVVDQVQIKHHFTHFTWHLRVQKLTAPPEQFAALQQSFKPSQWLSAEQAKAQGLPKAMQTVLAAFAIPGAADGLPVTARQAPSP